MCDLLKKSAIAYAKLSAYEYTLICGKKGNKIQIQIRFPASAYHHLAGFQYARIEALKEQKDALDTVLAGTVTYEQLIDSGFRHSDRLESLICLQECLETNQFVFRYNKEFHPFSKVKADYLMLFEDIVFFTDGLMPVSIFKNTETDYQVGCPRYTVLQIRRTNLETSEEITTYQREGYVDEQERRPA